MCVCALCVCVCVFDDDQDDTYNENGTPRHSSRSTVHRVCLIAFSVCTHARVCVLSACVRECSD